MRVRRSQRNTRRKRKGRRALMINESLIVFYRKNKQSSCRRSMNHGVQNENEDTESGLLFILLTDQWRINQSDSISLCFLSLLLLVSNLLSLLPLVLSFHHENGEDTERRRKEKIPSLGKFLSSSFSWVLLSLYLIERWALLEAQKQCNVMLFSDGEKDSISVLAFLMNMMVKVREKQWWWWIC